MKKFVLSLAVLAAMTAVSCSTSDKKAEDEGAAIKAKIENCQNPDSLAIYIQQAKDYATKLEAEGNADAAKAYLDEVAPAIQAKDPSAAGFVDKLINEADSTIDKAGEAVKDGADAVADKAEEAKDKAVEAGKEAVDAGKQAGKDAVDAGKQAVEQGKEKAAGAIQQGADKLKGALGK